MSLVYEVMCNAPTADVAALRTAAVQTVVQLIARASGVPEDAIYKFMVVEALQPAEERANVMASALRLISEVIEVGSFEDMDAAMLDARISELLYHLANPPETVKGVQA